METIGGIILVLQVFYILFSLYTIDRGYQPDFYLILTVVAIILCGISYMTLNIPATIIWFVCALIDYYAYKLRK